MQVTVKDLRLRDQILLSEGAYMCATVTRISKEGNVTVTRPYIPTPDFVYSAGNGGKEVIVYTGLEEVIFNYDTKHSFNLIYRPREIE